MFLICKRCFLYVLGTLANSVNSNSLRIHTNISKHLGYFIVINIIEVKSLHGEICGRVIK